MSRSHLTIAAGVVMLSGCGSTSQPAMQQIIPPAGGNAAVINCLTDQASDLGYKILRKDPGDGFLEAERRKDFTADSPKQYAVGDRFTVQRGKKNAEGIRPLELSMTSFRMDFLANGGQQTLLAPTDSGKADLNHFISSCGPLAPGASQ